MPKFLSVLVKPFAAVDYPARYFFYRLLIVLGALRLLNDLSLIVFDKEFMSGLKVFVLAFALSISSFMLEYFEQKKKKKLSI